MARKLKEIVCTKIAKQGRPKALVFNLTAVWSDGTRDELIRPYVVVFDFQTKLSEMFKDQVDSHMPEIPAARKFERNFLFGNNVDRKRYLVEDYFKKLLLLPDYIVNSDIFLQFFEKCDSDFVNGRPSTADNLRKCAAAKSTSIDVDFYDSDLGHYESVKDLDLPIVPSVTSLPPCSDALVDAATAEEHIYWAFNDYKKRSSGEVTLCAGSSVSVLQKDLTGWWFVEVQDGNQQGWAPASLLLPADRRYLDDIAETKPQVEYQAVCDYIGSGPDEVSYKKNDKIEVLEAKLDGWWKVSCDGHVGFTPAINLVPVTEAAEPNPHTNVYHQHSIYSKKSPPPRRNYDEPVEELYAKVDKLRGPTQSNVSTTANGFASSTEMELYAEIEPIQVPSNEKNSLPATALTQSNHGKAKSQQSQRLVAFPTKPSNPPPTLPPSARAAVACSTTSLPDSEASTGTNHRKQLPGVSNSIRSPPVSSAAIASGADNAPHTKPKLPIKPSQSRSVDSTASDDKSPSNTNSALDYFHANESGGSQTKLSPSPQQFNRQKGPPQTPSGNIIVSAPTTTRTSPTSGACKASVSALEHKTEVGHAGKASSPPVVNIGRADCDDMLLARGNPQDYIVRHSTKPGCPYALSVHCGDRVLHFPIELTVDRKYYIGKFSFDSLEAVIDYYSANTLCHVAETGNGIMLGHVFQVCRL